MFDKKIIDAIKGISILLILGIIISIAFILFYIEGKSVFKNNFIQAHHIDINFTYENKQIVVNDVYCYRMQGSSMNPSLFEGNTICLKKYINETLKQGNIIHYSTSCMDIVHRVASVQPDLIVVQGDNAYGQEIINKSDIMGILVATIYD